jgi:hypothetical protein
VDLQLMGLDQIRQAMHEITQAAMEGTRSIQEIQDFASQLGTKGEKEESQGTLPPNS